MSDNDPLVFIPDWGRAERVTHVLEFTQAMARDKMGAHTIGEMVSEILATGQNVYVKVVTHGNQPGDAK